MHIVCEIYNYIIISRTKCTTMNMKLYFLWLEMCPAAIVSQTNIYKP